MAYLWRSFAYENKTMPEQTDYEDTGQHCKTALRKPPLRRRNA